MGIVDIKNRLQQIEPILIQHVGIDFASINVSVNDIKLLLLGKHLQNFVFTYDKDVINSLNKAFNYIFFSNYKFDVSFLLHLNKILAFDSLDPGHFTTKSMKISGVKYHPVIPSSNEATNIIKSSLNSSSYIKNAIKVMLWLWRSQLFWDGNKRTGYFFANAYLLHSINGIIDITPQQLKAWYYPLLKFYNDGNIKLVSKLINNCCIKRI